MKNGSPNLTADERALKGRLLDPDKGGAQFEEECGAEADSLALIPRTSLFGVEFRFGPNVEPGHLSAGAKTLLNAFDYVSPRPGVTGRLTMRREALLQQNLLPLVQRHLVDASRDAVPERLNVVDLIFDSQAFEPGRRQRH